MIALYQLGMYATAIALVLFEFDRKPATIFFLALVWPLWLLATVQESIECVVDD